MFLRWSFYFYFSDTQLFFLHTVSVYSNDLTTNCYKKKAQAMQANIVVFHSLYPSCLFFSLLFTCLLSVIVCCVCCIMFDSLFQIKFSRNRHTPFIRLYWTFHTCGSMVLWLTQSPYTPKIPGLRPTHSLSGAHKLAYTVLFLRPDKWEHFIGKNIRCKICAKSNMQIHLLGETPWDKRE